MLFNFSVTDVEVLLDDYLDHLNDKRIDDDNNTSKLKTTKTSNVKFTNAEKSKIINQIHSSSNNNNNNNTNPYKSTNVISSNVIKLKNQKNPAVASIKKSRLELLKHVILENRKTIRTLEQKKIETLIEYSRIRNEFTAVKNKYDLYQLGNK